MKKAHTIVCAWMLLLCFSLLSLPVHALPGPTDSVFVRYHGAQEKPSVHTVRFDTAGGSPIDDLPVIDGERVLLDADPERDDGYLFAGWLLDGAPYDVFTPVTRDITLTARWVEDIRPTPTVDHNALSIDPGCLEFWKGMTLRLATICYAHAVRSDGYEYNRAYLWQPSLTFRSLDPSIASVDDSGNVTAHEYGVTYIWATVNEDAASPFGDQALEIHAGEVLGAIPVVVTGEPDFVRLYRSDPDNQRVTLTKATHTAVADFTSRPGDAFGSANIAVWYGNANAAFTMTVDDNLMGDFDQWNAWQETYGIPATFFAPSGNYYECGDTWMREIDLGMSVQSHSHYHHSSAEYNDPRTDGQEWADLYYSYLDMEQVGIHPRTIGYACGHNYAPISTQLFIAARGVSNAVIKSLNINYNNLTAIGSASVFLSSAPTLGDIPGGWLITYSHSIGSNAGTFENGYIEIKKQIDRGTVWATTFDRAARYAQERDTATVTVTGADAAAGVLTFSVTDRMNDLLFDYPLSVKITVDDTWSAARAIQNGQERAVEIVRDGDHVYAMVDAVPDRGEVTVVRSHVTVIQNERTATVKVTDAGGHDEIPMTVALTVDGDVWTCASATQNGRIADARLETVAGVTTFYVTVTPNAGALTARAGAEAAASCSMTDVYHRRVTADPDIPVDISTPEELYMLSDYVHRDGFTEGVTFRLTDDLDLTGYPVFDPIGWEHLSEASSGNYYRHPFRGFFEGGGHTISGLRVFRTVCGAGLFGTINGGAVRHLTVIGNVRGIKRTGGICGDAICTEFEDVVFSGHVRSVAHEKDRNGGSYVGGLIGQADSCTLTGCLVVDADVDARAAATESRWSRYYSRFVETSNKSYNNGCSIGGLIGGFNVRYGSGGSVATVITDCAVYASVTAHSVYQRNTGETWGGEKVGGLIGSGGGTLITDCLVDVNVSGRKNVGGIYGYQHNNPATKVYNTAAYGTVTALENAGGLDGWIGSNGSAYIENCFCGFTSVQAESNAAVCIGLTAGDGKNYPRPAYVRYLPVGDLPVTNYGEGASGGTYATGTEAENLQALNTVAASKGYGAWTIRNGRLDPTSLEVVRVDFVDGQGRVLAVRYAKAGAAVTPPAVPDEPGRVFRGWSEDLSCVTASMTVTALFETVETYTVTFLGRGGETLAAGTVNRGAALPAVTAPILTGLIFDGWQGMTGDTVEHDLTLTAGYRPDTAALAPLVEALDAAATSEQKHAAIRAVADFVALWNEEERDADLPVAYVAARADYDRRSASGAADLAAALTLFGD